MKSYEITTLADIFNKVPSDRIQDCCAELGTLLSTTKAMAELMLDMAKETGAVPTDTSLAASMGLKYPLVWQDDGKGNVQTDFVAEGSDDPLLTVKVKRKKSKGVAA